MWSIVFIFSLCCLRVKLVGEEFESSVLEGNSRQRQALYAAFVRGIDVQDRLLSLSIRASIAGGALTILVWAWILLEKMV